LFIFAHEVAHLKENASSGFVDIWEIVKRFLNNKIKKEEMRADDKARESVKKSLKKISVLLHQCR
jgi:hypothetical protein